ncbi:MAG: YqcC family protein [Alcanivoracaceae bacterium]|nr:YqcC family protein [Alcanivoracaceae bacterium]
MTSPNRERLLMLIDNIEREMQTLSLWDAQPPEQHAFQSNLPFFADTMSFAQWLQWVFLARFRAILEGEHPLPNQCNIAPMAEEGIQHINQDITSLIALLKEFDNQF